MHLTETWRLKGQRYSLTTNRNNETHEVTFPPRNVAKRELDVFKFDVNDTKSQENKKVVEGVAQ